MTKDFIECIEGSRSKATGLFLHKRFSNFPLELVKTLFSNLYEDIVWAKQQANSTVSSEYTEDDNIIFNEFKNMTHVMLIGSCSCVGLQIAENSSVEMSGNILFDDFEDEIFVQSSNSTILYALPSSKSLLFVSIIPLSQYKASVDEISKFCSA